MNRRDFLAATATITLAAPLFAAKSAFAANSLAYTDGLEKTLLAEGKTVFLDFSATWCGTCKAQERVIDALRAEDPAYDAGIAFVRVDWDDFGDGSLSKSLNIPRRSVLVVLRGDAELGRVVAQTGREEIKTLMDLALTPAT
jgi:thioredoxin 1